MKRSSPDRHSEYTSKVGSLKLSISASKVYLCSIYVLVQRPRSASPDNVDDDDYVPYVPLKERRKAEVSKDFLINAHRDPLLCTRTLDIQV